MSDFFCLKQVSYKIKFIKIQREIYRADYFICMCLSVRMNVAMQRSHNYRVNVIISVIKVPLGQY